MWMQAFNYAFKRFNGNESRAFQYAWGVVKKIYTKRGDRWVKKNSLDLRSDDDEWLHLWVANNAESLELKTSNIANILPKRFWELRVKHAITLPPHHGKMLWEGTKTAIIKQWELKELIGEPIHLIEDTVCYGTIRLTSTRLIDEQDFNKLAGRHRYTEDERQRWWKHGIMFYHEVDWLRKFPGPLPVKIRRGGNVVLYRKDYSFKSLDRLENSDLLWIHSYCHTGHSNSIKQFHDLLAVEITSRGLTHPVYSPLDEDIPSLPDPKMSVHDVPPMGLEPDSIGMKITLDAFLSALPDQFSIEEPPAQIWLSGAMISDGYVNTTDPIDIVIKQKNPDMRIPRKFVRDLKNLDRVRVRVSFSTDEPEGIPLYRTSYQRMPSNTSLSLQSLRKVLSKSPEYTSIAQLWDNWASTRVGIGIVAEKKYDGIGVFVQRTPESVIIRVADRGLRYSNDNMANMFPSMVTEISTIDTPFVATGEIVCYDCNNILVDNKEEMCKPIMSRSGNDTDTVFHMNDLIAVNGIPAAGSYIENIQRLEELIDGLVHLRVVPYVICNSKPDIETGVAALSRLPGSMGVRLRVVPYIRPSSGKTPQMVTLSKDYEDNINIETCEYVGVSGICPLHELSVPTDCSIAITYRCPFLKDEVYNPETHILEIKNWAPEIEPET